MRRGSEQGVRVAFAPSAWVAPHPKAEKRDISGGAFRAIRRQGTRQGTNYVYVFHTYSSHFGDVCRYIPREGASWETALNDVLDPASRYIPREGASWEDDILNDAIRNMDTSRARVRVGSALASPLSRSIAPDTSRARVRVGSGNAPKNRPAALDTSRARVRVGRQHCKRLSLIHISEPTRRS